MTHNDKRFCSIFTHSDSAEDSAMPGLLWPSYRRTTLSTDRHRTILLSKITQWCEQLAQPSVIKQPCRNR